MCLGAYAHQDLPFEKLVEELQPARVLSRQPLFQVMFALQNVPVRRWSFPGLQRSLEPREPVTSKFDLSLSLREACAEVCGRHPRGVRERTCSIARRSSRLRTDWSAVLEADCGGPGATLGPHAASWRRVSATPSAGMERHASGIRRDAAGAVRRAGGAHAGCGRGGV